MKNDLRVFGALIKRGLRVFYSDKAGVMFSMMAPIIILVLYILFLGEVQTSSIESVINEFGVTLQDGILRSYVDGWMLAGVMAVSCITVSFTSQGMMVQDRERGVVADMLSAPVKRGVLSISYLFYNFVVTLITCSVVLVIAFIYLAIAGWYLSVAQVFKIIAMTLMSVLSASLFSSIVCGFIRTGNVHSAIIGIMSAAIGFLIGAYMPVSTFPKAIQYLILFIPGTYSAGVFRNVFTQGAGDVIGQQSPQAIESINEGFSMNMDFFGKSIGENEMWWIFAITIAILMMAYIIIHAIKAKRGTLLSVQPNKKSKFGKNKAKS